MSEEPNDDGSPKPKKSKAMLFAVVAAILLGGGSFYGVYSGMVPLPLGGEAPTAETAPTGAAHGDTGHVGDPDATDRVVDHAVAAGAFVAIPSLVISLGAEAEAKHLKVTISLEIEPGQEEQVTAVTPRINDVLNTYLRAVDERDFEIPRSMIRLRAQMLRRIQLVTPRGSVRDVLIQEFVLN